MQRQSRIKFPDHHEQKQISPSGKPALTHHVQAIFRAHKQTMLMAMLNAITNLNILCNISSKKEKSRVLQTGILEGCKPGKKKTKAHFPSIETGNVVVLTLIAHPP